MLSKLQPQHNSYLNKIKDSDWPNYDLKSETVWSKNKWKRVQVWAKIHCQLLVPTRVQYSAAQRDEFNIILGDDSHPYRETTVCSSTYPCISFRCQRVSHPGTEPGSGRLDGDGITDARQLAACCKERSEMGTSRASPIWVLRLVHNLLQGLHFHLL